MYDSLNTFAEVATRYNETKPLVSIHHTREDDLRPISRRDRKWEHIEKVGSDEYILHDSFAYHGIARRRPPIVWQRGYFDVTQCEPTQSIKNGGPEQVEIITVRGAVHPHGHDTTRYEFLRKFLPISLQFDAAQNGRHTVTAEGHSSSDEQFLPAPKTSLESGFDSIDYSLRFQRVGLFRWTCVTKRWPETRWYVDKEKKAALREELDCFYEWMCSIGPMLPPIGYEYRSHIIAEVAESLGSSASTMWIGGGMKWPLSTALEILGDCNHSLRVHMAVSFLDRNDIRNITTVEESKQFRANYNSWANKTFGLMTEREI